MNGLNEWTSLTGVIDCQYGTEAGLKFARQGRIKFIVAPNKIQK